MGPCTWGNLRCSRSSLASSSAPSWPSVVPPFVVYLRSCDSWRCANSLSVNPLAGHRIPAVVEHRARAAELGAALGAAGEFDNLIHPDPEQRERVGEVVPAAGRELRLARELEEGKRLARAVVLQRLERVQTSF